MDVYFAKHDIQSVVSDILCFGRIGTRLACLNVTLIHLREPWRKNILYNHAMYTIIDYNATCNYIYMFIIIFFLKP